MNVASMQKDSLKQATLITRPADLKALAGRMASLLDPSMSWKDVDECDAHGHTSKDRPSGGYPHSPTPVNARLSSLISG